MARNSMFHFFRLFTVMSLNLVRSAPSREAGPEEKLDIRMPNVQPQEPDTYLCTSVRIPEARKFIRGFVPHAESSVSHHMLLYGCNVPGSSPGHIWNCGEMHSQSSQYRAAPICRAGTNILYAWAMEAPELNLPKDVSFQVGQDTPVKYLVMQVHYKNVSRFLPPHNGKDSSGLTLLTSTRPTSKLAGVYLMLTGGSIPSHTIEYMEAACYFTEDVEIVPFAYRTHAHSLGRVISGYRVRDGQWTEIGRQDPRRPEMFYNTTNPGMTVRRGDILAARCTMENTLDHEVSVGPTQLDEMCNFYVMYHVHHQHTLREHTCQTPGPPFWFWRDFPDQDSLNLQAVPATASLIPGTDKPLLRNATELDEQVLNRQDLAGEFQDDRNQELIAEALGRMSGQELLSLAQELAARDNQQQVPDDLLWQLQQQL